jgi:hypothetical protein
MSRLEHLARCLVAAGVALLGDQGTFLLYVDNSALISKEWIGKSFGNQELIASSVLPSSVASYIVTATGRLVICISSTSTLRAVTYDEDEGEWVDDKSPGQHKLHPQGKVSGSAGEDGSRHVFFQDPSKRLIHLNNAWAPTVLPVNAVEGSPLATAGDNGQVCVFYVSASDGYIHYATQQKDGSWSDTIFTRYAFVGNEKPTRFLISQPVNDGGDLVVFALTEGRTLLQISADGQNTLLGAVDEAGGWVPTSKEEAVASIIWPGCIWPPRGGGWPGGGWPRGGWPRGGY